MRIEIVAVGCAGGRQRQHRYDDRDGPQQLSTGSSGVLVLVVGELTAGNVTVTGTRALAIVADGDVMLNGVLSVSARLDVPGAGALVNGDGTCEGRLGEAVVTGGTDGGGGGFGSLGGRGGSVGHVARRCGRRTERRRNTVAVARRVSGSPCRRGGIAEPAAAGRRWRRGPDLDARHDHAADREANGGGAKGLLAMSGVCFTDSSRA